MKIFDWIKHIVQLKTPYTKFSNEDFKSFDNYMIHLLLSMNPSYIELIDEIQSLNNISKEKLYRLYCNLIPKNNRTYFPYIKSQNKKLNEDKLQYVANVFECSLYEANEYTELMDKEWLENILTKYGLENKQIKQLTK